MAFHLGCLRALNEVGLLDRVNVISTISGGSVIGAYYVYTPGKSFQEFESDIRRFLRKGFQRGMLVQTMKPRNAYHGVSNAGVATFDILRERVFRRPARVRIARSRSDLLKAVLQERLFGDKKLSSRSR